MRAIKFSLVGMFALIFAGCGDQLTSSSPTGGIGIGGGQISNKVAILLPLSGPLQSVGEEMRNAINMAYSALGTDLEIQFFDTQGSGEGAQAAGAQAAAFDAGLVLGPLLGANIASTRFGLGSESPAILALSNDVAKAGGNNYIFGLTPSNSAKRILEYAVAQGKTRIGILYPENDFGRAATTAALNMAPLMGVTIVISEGYSPSAGRDGAASRQEAASKVGAQREAIDGVFIPDGGGRLREIASLAFFYEIDPRRDTYLGTQLMDDASLTVEPALNGAKFSALQGTLAEFETRFASTYGVSPRSISAVAYDAMALAATLKATGKGFSPASLTSPDGFTGVMGTYRIQGDGTTERLMSIKQITSTGLQVVESAGASFVF